MNKKNKYNAKKTIVNGIKFDSKAEATRYKILKKREAIGEISGLTLQPRFTLQEKFKHGGKTIRKIEYIADFEYTKDGQQIVEDVKGVKTDVYKLKKKIFLMKYGKEKIFKEITRKELTK